MHREKQTHAQTHAYAYTQAHPDAYPRKHICTYTPQPDCGDCPDPDKFVIAEDQFTDQWAQSMRDLGVTYAVMVLKQH